MNERLQELLNEVQRTAGELGAAAAGAAGGMGRRAEALVSVAKLNIQLMELRAETDRQLQAVGRMIYGTHTGTPTDSETLLAKLREIDGLQDQIARAEAEIARLQNVPVCPICGAASRPGDAFCRECGGKL